MKKYLLSVGSIAATMVPIITVVSCGNEKAPKTDADFGKAIIAKKDDIKTFAKTLIKKAMTSEIIKTKTMELVGTTYNALKDDLIVVVEDSTATGLKKITLTVKAQTPIVIDNVKPSAPKTLKEFATAIKAKEADIKKYAETLNRGGLGSGALTKKVMELVGPNYTALARVLRVLDRPSTTKGKVKIKIIVETQTKIIIDNVKPAAPKTNKEFATAIKAKEAEIKAFVETFTRNRMIDDVIKNKTIDLVGPNYTRFFNSLVFAFGKLINGKMTITFKVKNQPIIKIVVTPKTVAETKKTATI